jgi:hypothetical protein
MPPTACFLAVGGVCCLLECVLNTGGMIGNYALNDLWIVRKFWRMLANYGGMIGNYLRIMAELWSNYGGIMAE